MTRTTLLYFAYGSNMLLSRIRQQDRAPSARVVTTATLPGHMLMFHKRASDGSAKCDVVPSEGADRAVYGVIFAIPENERLSLDRAEGLGNGYHTKQVSVVGAKETLSAFSYAADPGHIAPSLLPYIWYKELVLAGARQHALPESYIGEIEKVAAIADPDRTREMRARELLRRQSSLH